MTADMASEQSTAAIAFIPAARPPSEPDPVHLVGDVTSPRSLTIAHPHSALTSSSNPVTANAAVELPTSAVRGRRG